jgi:monoamine oxidase
VKIRTSGSAFRARRVILAMPPLHAGRILAGDRIPAARRQVEIRSPLGGGYKFHFVYDDPFWRSEGLSGQALSFDHPVSSVFDGSPMDSSCGVLTGLCEPLRSRELATATPEERQIVATRCLAEFFGDKASRPRAVIEKYWEQDPWSLGCVFYMTPGAWTTCGEALRRPVGRVHFAGTETATDSICNMNGAVQAGWRAAEEVAAGL